METALITAPAVEPVLLAGIKPHIRLTDTDTDSNSYIDSLLTVARQVVEQMCNRALITQTWEVYLDEWPGGDFIELPKGSLQSVTSIKYTDSDDDESIFSSDDYSVDTGSMLGRVVLMSGESWPTVTLATNNPIVIQFVCGYGAAGSDVPGPINQAIKFMVADYFENRETVVVGTITSKLDMVNQLLSPYRLYGYHL